MFLLRVVCFHSLISLQYSGKLKGKLTQVPWNCRFCIMQVK